MSTFILTAKTDITRGNTHLNKGDVLTISIAKLGVSPYNLFSKDENLPILRKQFEANGIYFKNDNEIKYLFGSFDIKKV
jgi:hypothetical protein